MLYFNENMDNSGADALFDKMIAVLRQRGFYADDNKEHDPCHFLTEQEQTVYQSAIEYYNAIPFLRAYDGIRASQICCRYANSYGGIWFTYQSRRDVPVPVP